MKNIILTILILLAGCIQSGFEEVVTEDTESYGAESGPRRVALTSEDLGSGGWVRSAENETAFVFERRFRRVEDTFGAVSGLVNRVHKYPDPESALLDFRLVEEQLVEDVSLKTPEVGEAAILWIQERQGYLLFVRGSYAVEFEYSSPDVVEEGFLLEQAHIIDSRIIS